MRASTADYRAYRLTALDALRGLVIVIMALDHCRDFLMLGTSQDPMSNPDITPGLFATRWITHFCAPTFVFLAGTSAGLMGARKAPAELGRFLLLRGLWLVVVEALVVSNGWTFAPAGVAALGGAARTHVPRPARVAHRGGLSVAAVGRRDAARVRRIHPVRAAGRAAPRTVAALGIWPGRWWSSVCTRFAAGWRRSSRAGATGG